MKFLPSSYARVRAMLITAIALAGFSRVSLLHGQSVSLIPSTMGNIAGTTTSTDNSLDRAATTGSISQSGTDLPEDTPLASASTTVMQFGSVPTNESSVQTLTITNIGGGTLTLSPSIDGSSTTISGSTCGAGVQGGASCALQIRFQAIQANYRHDTLTIATNGANTLYVHILGTGTGILIEGINDDGSLQPLVDNTLAFGDLPVGQEKKIKVAIVNSGVLSGVTVKTTSLAAPDFPGLYVGDCLTPVKPNAYCTATVTFKPKSGGIHRGWILIGPSVGNLVLFKLSGNGTRP